MITIKYIIDFSTSEQLLSYRQLFYIDSEMINKRLMLEALSQYASENNCLISLNEGDTNLTYTYIWLTQTDLDNFITFADEITGGYDKFTSDIQSIVESNGGSLEKQIVE